MPKKVGEKVKFVQEKLTKGTWGYVVGAPNDQTETKAQIPGDGSGAAAANAAAHAALSGTRSQTPYAQGYGQQQMPIASGYTGTSHGQQGMMNLPVPAQTGFQPPYTYGQDLQQAAQMGFNPAMQGQSQTHGYGPPPAAPEFGYAQKVPDGYPPPPLGGGYEGMRRWG